MYKGMSSADKIIIPIVFSKYRVTYFLKLYFYVRYTIVTEHLNYTNNYKTWYIDKHKFILKIIILLITSDIILIVKYFNLSVQWNTSKSGV